MIYPLLFTVISATLMLYIKKICKKYLKKKGNVLS